MHLDSFPPEEKEPIVTVNGENNYSLFNNGMRSGADVKSFSPYSNYDDKSLLNGGYDLVANSGTANERIRLGRSITINGTVKENALLNIYAYDIDEESGERSLIYLVDETDGTEILLENYLSGRNDTWTTTTLTVDRTYFINGHTYHFELYESVIGWNSWTRNVSLQLNVSGGSTVVTPVIVEHSQSASIDKNGMVTVDLNLRASEEMTISIEYSAIIDGFNKGGMTSDSITLGTSLMKNTAFFYLQSDAQPGVYIITIIIKDADNNVIATYLVSAGYLWRTVNYDSNGGSSIHPIDTKRYSNGDVVNVLFDDIPSRDGYIFLGWSVDPFASIPEYTYTGEKSFEIGDNDITLYAIWKGDICYHTNCSYVVDIEPDCINSGIQRYVCDDCKAVLFIEGIPALGHDFVDGECTRCHIHQYTITVNYVYSGGGTAQPSVVITLMEGEKYSITSPVIKNYTADRLVVSGTAIQSLNITVTYKEVEAEIITSIRTVSLGNIDYNTPYSSLMLPETVNAVTASGKTVQLKVFWNSSDYNAATFGEQTINGTVIAAYGYKFSCEAKTTATLTVTKNIIVSIPAMNLGKLPIGTSFEGLGVPSTAAVITNSGKTFYLPVVWDEYSYDSSVAGKHTIHGTITLETGYTLASGVVNDVEISFELSETMYGTADIVFLIDTTGSMGDEINNVKNNIKSFADMLEREGVSVRWALIEYRDITCDGLDSTRIIYCGSSDWYIDVDAYKDAISRLIVSGGGDREETVIDALKTATLLETRADAQSFYIVVTDADYKINNQYGISSMSAMINELKANETITSVVTKTTYYNVYRNLTDGTGGILANIDGNFASELWKLSDLIIEDVVFGSVESIEITTAPSKTRYTSGDYFDETGMEVKAIYTSGAEKYVTGYSVSPTRALSVSDSSVEINYRGRIATLPITVTETARPVTGVSVNPSLIEMKSGERKTIIVTVTPSNATNKNVYWTTDNPNVATVKDGVIEAFEPGTAIITVYTDDGGYSAVVTVHVIEKTIHAEGIYLDTGSIELYVGESKKAKATVYPADTTDKTVVWASENEDIAIVDANGNITAVAKGNVTVTATTVDGEFIGMVLVTVIEYDAAAPKYSILSAKGFAGDTVEIYIAVENNPGIISLRNYISYDMDALELISIENTGLLNGFTNPAPNISSPYILRWTDALATQNNLQNGNIVKLTFKIKEGISEGLYEVSVTPVESRNFMGQSIEFSSATSYIEVVDYITGDADGDGELSDWDAILFERYLAGWDVEINLDAMDIDHDGEISDWDAIIFERYLAGWDVSIA